MGRVILDSSGHRPRVFSDSSENIRSETAPAAPRYIKTSAWVHKSLYSCVMRRFRPIVLVILAALSTQAQQLQTPHSAWWTHVEALANDGMEGRNTGSAGHKRAAEYVATEFKKAGLEAAGIDGY